MMDGIGAWFVRRALAGQPVECFPPTGGQTLSRQAGSRPGGARRRLRSPFVILSSAVLLAGCGADSYRMTDANAAALTGGNPEEGAALIRTYGCGSCHTIAGVPGASRQVGPPLTGLANRMYIAGVLPNSPENLVSWIQDPKAIDPLTAMPDVGVKPADARSIAAYLYTLK